MTQLIKYNEAFVTDRKGILRKTLHKKLRNESLSNQLVENWFSSQKIFKVY